MPKKAYKTPPEKPITVNKPAVAYRQTDNGGNIFIR
jgi:hypothetical protein